VVIQFLGFNVSKDLQGAMDTLSIAIPGFSGQPPFMLDIRQIVGQELTDG